MAAPPSVRVSRLLAGAILVLATGGCGFVSALANPPQPDDPGATPTAGSSASADAPRLAAEADLVDPTGRHTAVLRVTVQPRQSGVRWLIPIGSSFAQACGFTDDTTWSVAVAIDIANDGPPTTKQESFDANLAARVELRGTPPAGEQAGVVVPPYRPETVRYCEAGPQLQTTDSFTSGETSSGYHATVTGYVVLRTASGAQPSLTGLTVALTDLQKVHAGGDLSEPWAWQVQRFESGSACPDGPASVCVPLG